jgi:hypothetical protein
MNGSEHVSAAITSASVAAEVLDAGERSAVVLRLRERLGVDVKRHHPWDDRSAPDGRLRPDGWELVPTYMGAEPCLMFLDGADVIWKFATGNDLLRVLKECPALEFYVCNEDAGYLLCSNHHDYLIGWGTAGTWVAKLDD